MRAVDMLERTTSTWEHCTAQSSLNLLLCTSIQQTSTVGHCHKHFHSTSLTGCLMRSFVRMKQHSQVVTYLRQGVSLTLKGDISASLGEFYLQTQITRRFFLYVTILNRSQRTSLKSILNNPMRFTIATTTIRSRRR